MLKNRIRTLMRKILNTYEYDYKIQRMQEEIESLYYIVNHCIDVSTVKPAKGSLRKLQIADAILLKIFDEVCTQAGLQYWIDFGTLLGGYRHKGFIPWDDDTDVSMLPTDFNLVVEVIQKALKEYGIEVYTEHWPERIGIGYKHEFTGVWLDVFPTECIHNDNRFTNEEIKKRIAAYKKWCKRNKSTDNGTTIAEQKANMFPICSETEMDILLPALESDSACFLIKSENLFPLKRVLFEGIELNAPNNEEAFLHEYYGKDFMKFPKRGIEHHGGQKGKIYNWAEMNGIEMDTIIEELNSIYESVRR